MRRPSGRPTPWNSKTKAQTVVADQQTERYRSPWQVLQSLQVLFLAGNADKDISGVRTISSQQQLVRTIKGLLHFVHFVQYCSLYRLLVVWTLYGPWFFLELFMQGLGKMHFLLYKNTYSLLYSGEQKMMSTLDLVGCASSDGISQAQIQPLGLGPEPEHAPQCTLPLAILQTNIYFSLKKYTLTMTRAGRSAILMINHDRDLQWRLENWTSKRRMCALLCCTHNSL